MSNTFLQGGAKIFSGKTKPSRPLLVTGLIIGNDFFLFFISLHCPQRFSAPPSPTNVPASLADVFRGVGVNAKEYHIQVQEGVVGVIQSPRKIPYAVQPRLKEVIAELTRNGVVADVDCPTEWVNNLVLVQKKDKFLGICLDPRPLN